MTAAAQRTVAAVSALALNMGLLWALGYALADRAPDRVALVVELAPLREEVAPLPSVKRPPHLRRPDVPAAAPMLPRPPEVDVRFRPAEARPLPPTSAAPARPPPRVAGMAKPLIAPSVAALPMNATPPASSSEPLPRQADAAPKSPVDDAAAALMERYRAVVRLRIERAKRYPRWAMRRGVTGDVTVSFTLEGDGGLRSAGVSESSGVEGLDEAALHAVENAAPFPAHPLGALRGGEPFTVTISFKGPGG